jgi:transposase-like protein
MDCPARGQSGEGNIRIHSRTPARYHGRACGKTFSPRVGTAFFRRRSDEETFSRVVTLVGNGCPIPAIEAAFGLQAQTVREWVDASGQHCERLHHQQAVAPRNLEQVQADEIRLTTQAGVVWMALALMVTTRFWLAGAISPTRDRNVIERLVAVVAGCCSFGPLLFVTDGLKTYSDVVRKAFRTRQTGTGGRPRLSGWPDLMIAQVIKQYTGRAVTGMIHRLVHGSVQMFLMLLWSTPGCQVLNTAYIERLNGTFRSRLAVFGRRTRVLARRVETVERGMYLVGTLYNFCCVHCSLRQADGGKRTSYGGEHYRSHLDGQRGAALSCAAPCWQPPQRRGRRSRALQALIERWCPHHRLA